MKPALIVTVLGLLVLGAALVSAQPTTCTETGTDERDVMAGGRGPDTLCLLGGADYGHGNGGDDHILGGPGADTLVAGKGIDVVHGNGGDDRIFIVDNRAGDTAKGGPGNDQCFVDESDRARGCEEVFRGHSITPRQYLALQSSFFGGLELAEDLIEEPPPPATVTVTVTHTASFPPCTPPPDQPPAPC
jgi:hypothetical protein